MMRSVGTTACGRTPARPAVKKIQPGCRIQAPAAGVIGRAKARSLGLEGATLSGTALKHEKRSWKIQWDARGQWSGAEIAVASKRLTAYAPANAKTAWCPLVERELSLGVRVTASAVALLGKEKAQQHFPKTFEDQMLVGTTRSHHKKSWEVDWDPVGDLWPGARLPLLSQRMKPVPIAPVPAVGAAAAVVATAKKASRRQSSSGKIRRVGHDDSDDDMLESDGEDGTAAGGLKAGAGGTSGAGGGGAAARKAVPVAKRKAGDIATPVRAVPAAAAAAAPVGATAAAAAAAAAAPVQSPVPAAASAKAAAAAPRAKKQKKRPNRMPLGDRVYILTTVNTDAHEPVSEVYGVYNSFDIALSNASNALGWKSNGPRFWEWPVAEFKKHCEEVTNKYDSLRSRGGLQPGQMQTVYEVEYNPTGDAVRVDLSCMRLSYAPGHGKRATPS